MHKEKVSRREIGVFTAVRRVPRSHKILPPPQPAAGTQPRPQYSRQPINYQQLDDLGHGMKVSYTIQVAHVSVCYVAVSLESCPFESLSKQPSHS